MTRRGDKPRRLTETHSDQGRVRRAFAAPANLIALAATAAAAALSHVAEPLWIALSVEAAYLSGAAVISPRIWRALRGRGSGDAVRDALLDELSESQREHYLALRAMRDQILENHRKLPGGRVLAASSEERVDALLTTFVRLLATLNHYRRFLSSSDQRQVAKELAELEADIGRESSARVREVKEKRVDILRRRLSRFSQAQESREVVSHQLAGIEDLLRLTLEQSIAIRDPATVGAQLEALTAEVQASEESVREMERFLEFEEITGPPVSHRLPVR